MKKFIILFLVIVGVIFCEKANAYTTTNFRIDWKEIYVVVPLNESIEKYKNDFIVNVYVDNVLQIEDIDYYVVIGVNGTSTSTINTSKAARHRIDVKVTLYDYSASSVNTVTYDVVDDEAPEFETSSSSITTKHGVVPDYEAFFKANDNSGKEVKITVDESFIDYNLLGPHKVTINATDVNNQVTSMIVTVYVVDVFAPRITLKNVLNITIGGTIDVNNFFYGFDDFDKDITNLIKIEPFNNMILGDQQIYATLEDSSGNYTRLQFTLSITDNTAPTIHFTTNDAKIDIENDITYDLFKNFIMYVEDDGTRLNVSDIKIDFSSVLNELGTYTVIYYATDAVGNTSETRLSVRVVQTTGPQIICKNITVKTGDTFDDSFINSHINIYDQYDSSAINTLRLDLSGVNLGVPGIYMVLVSACNSSGVFTYETLMITVEKDGFIDFATYWPLLLIALAPIGYFGYKQYMKKQSAKYED